MKPLTASVLATLLTAASHLTAAEPESAFGLTPTKPDTLLPAGSGELPLIPETISPTAKPALEKVKKERKSPTEAAEDALRDRIKLRQVKTKAERDPGLQALWAEGLAARTDYDQRRIWKDYYTQLYALMGRLDRTLKKADLEALRDGDINRFKQDRIAPTEPPRVAPTARR